MLACVLLKKDESAAAAPAGGSSLLSEAIDEYNWVIEANPNFPCVRGKLGDALKRAGRYDEAIAVYDESLRRQPTWPFPHAAKADVVDSGKGGMCVTLLPL